MKIFAFTLLIQLSLVDVNLLAPINTITQVTMFRRGKDVEHHYPVSMQNTGNNKWRTTRIAELIKFLNRRPTMAGEDERENTLEKITITTTTKPKINETTSFLKGNHGKEVPNQESNFAVVVMNDEFKNQNDGGKNKWEEQPTEKDSFPSSRKSRWYPDDDPPQMETPETPKPTRKTVKDENNWDVVVYGNGDSAKTTSNRDEVNLTKVNKKRSEEAEKKSEQDSLTRRLLGFKRGVLPISFYLAKLPFKG